MYPNDGTDQGKALRLKQQHFFVSASLQDMLRSLDKRGLEPVSFPDYWQVQLNDTHPAIAVAELMRLLVDEKHLDWDAAWEITTKSIAYTQPYSTTRGIREVGSKIIQDSSTKTHGYHL